MSDGDTLFALSTGLAPAIDFNVLCAMAGEAVARACINAVRAARGLNTGTEWLPSATDLEAARA
jgi:L-aminopeptidase/D-esterase-like protein